MPDIIVAQRMWQRRDTAANWTAKNPVMESGEIGVELSANPSVAHKFKIGNGSTPWSGLPYAGSEGGIEEAPLDGKIYGRKNGAWVEIVGVTSISYDTDTFDTDDLYNYTQYADSGGDWSISGGELHFGNGTQSVITRNGVSLTNGQISCVINTADDAGLVLRLQDNNNYYLCVIADNSSSGTGSRATIYKRVGGGYTNCGYSAIDFPRGTSHTVTFSANGSTLEVTYDGTVILNVTDTSISSAGKCGVRGNAVGSNKPIAFESFTWPT